MFIYEDTIRLIIDKIDSDFQKEIERHDDHKRRVIACIEWFNERAIPSEMGGIEHRYVVVNDVVCLCTAVDFRGTPYYNVSITVRPLNSTDDIGFGCGNQKTINF